MCYILFLVAVPNKGGGGGGGGGFTDVQEYILACKTYQNIQFGDTYIVFLCFSVYLDHVDELNVTKNVHFLVFIQLPFLKLKAQGSSQKQRNSNWNVCPFFCKPIRCPYVPGHQTKIHMGRFSRAFGLFGHDRQSRLSMLTAPCP